MCPALFYTLSKSSPGKSTKNIVIWKLKENVSNSRPLVAHNRMFPVLSVLENSDRGSRWTLSPSDPTVVNLNFVVVQWTRSSENGCSRHICPGCYFSPFTVFVWCDAKQGNSSCPCFSFQHHHLDLHFCPSFSAFYSSGMFSVQPTKAYLTHTPSLSLVLLSDVCPQYGEPTEELLEPRLHRSERRHDPDMSACDASLGTDISPSVLYRKQLKSSPLEQTPVL